MTCVRLRLCNRGVSLEPEVYRVRNTYTYANQPTNQSNGRQRNVAAAARSTSVATRGGPRARCCPREARRKDRPTICPPGAFKFCLLLYAPFSFAQVDGLSELFVMWDEVLRTAEDSVTKLEKEREERSRRGYD